MLTHLASISARRARFVLGLSLLCAIAGCAKDVPDATPDTQTAIDAGPELLAPADTSSASEDTLVDDGPRPAPYATDTTGHGLAGGCFAIDAAAPGKSTGRLLVASTDGARFAFTGTTLDTAARLTLEPTDLGTFLLRDAEGRFLAANKDGALERLAALESDVTRNEDGYVSPAVWALSPASAGRFGLRNVATGAWLGTTGTVTDTASAAAIAFYPTTGCVPFPELALNATGSIVKTTFPDGDLFGFVDAHEHLFTNLAFGAGGVFHGAPFHPLGVEHALGSCEPFHGKDGRRDLVGYFMGGGAFDPATAAAALLSGDTGAFNHHTDGYPDFVHWPGTTARATHQGLYHRWLERAWMGGLRLLVQHATTNEVLCQMSTGLGLQKPRLSCNEMVAVDRILDATRALERYIDAHAGGPGKGWFRIVTTPAEARKIIQQGKLAVVLGIETSTLFDCYVTERPGFPKCTSELVKAKLDTYRERGVRAIFPVHKFDNGFSAGDGHRGFIEIGNVANTGYYGNFTNVACPVQPDGYDHGAVTFGGLNQPRATFDGPPPLDASTFPKSPVEFLAPLLSKLTEPKLEGDYCQQTGLTPLGETLMHEMMLRGLIIEIDHMPRRSRVRAYELLHAANYPAAGTHQGDNDGDLYSLGGISNTNLPRCQRPDQLNVGHDFAARIARIKDHGGYPAQGVALDNNGFAPQAGPRFGKNAGCTAPQTKPIAYPFTSFAGDVTFSSPVSGKRTFDFNTEGMAHVGLLPELIQDARAMGMTDAELEPFFRSAEGYIRMWERAESRAKALK